LRFSLDAVEKVKSSFFEATLGLFGQCQKKAVSLAKIQAASIYLKAIQALHKQAVVLALALFVSFTLAVAIVVAPFMVVLFAPLAPSAKFVLVCLLAVLDLAIPSILLSRLLSERKWMEITKARDFISQALQEN